MSLADLLDRPSWQAEGACNGVSPDLWFPERGGSTREAKATCRGCPVREPCLEYALTTGQKFGIWGGMSERQRREIRKARAIKPRPPSRNYSEELEAHANGVKRAKEALKMQAMSNGHSNGERPLEWSEAVERGREMVTHLSGRYWELGDLALSVAPMGKPGEKGARDRLPDFAKAIGCESYLVVDYRNTSSSWPVETRQQAASWTAHRILRSHPDRAAVMAELVAEKGRVTVRDARPFAVSRQARRHTAEALSRRIDRLARDIERLDADPEQLRAIGMLLASLASDVSGRYHDARRPADPQPVRELVAVG